MKDNTQIPDRYCYKIKEVAAMLGVTRQSVNNMMRRGDIPYIKLKEGKQAAVRILKEDFEAFINRGKVAK